MKKVGRQPGAPKTGGRTAGTPNKITNDLRTRISDFLADNWEIFQDDFSGLEPEKRMAFYEKLLQYGLPRLQATEFTNKFDVNELSNQELDILIERIKSA